MGLPWSRGGKALCLFTVAVLSAGCPSVHTPSGATQDEAGDRQAIAALLDAQESAPFFQSRLINDGVGIFSLESAPAGLPRRWGRSYLYGVQGQPNPVSPYAAITFNHADEAIVLYKQPVAGKLVLDYPWQRTLLSKPFVETSLRTARIRKEGDAWRLTDVNLAQVKPDGVEFKLGTVTLKLDGGPSRRFKVEDYLSLDDLPQGKPETWGRLEVEISYPGSDRDPAFYAFLSVPPSRDRLILRDDGRGSDVTAGDGIYSAAFILPSEPGLRHLVIDVIAAKTFADPATTNYEATQWGIPYRVQGGEAR